MEKVTESLGQIALGVTRRKRLTMIRALERARVWATEDHAWAADARILQNASYPEHLCPKSNPACCLRFAD